MTKQIKIIIAIVDSLATLKANGSEFCSEDSSKLWEGIVLSNSDADTITNCTLINAATTSAQYMRFAGLQHIKTSIAYQQGNGKIERYHRKAQEECLSKSSYIDIEDAKKQIAEFVEFYNTKRLHSSLCYLTPEDFMLNERKIRSKRRYINSSK